MNKFSKLFLKVLWQVLLFLTLTLLTQVGGIIWFLIRGIGKRFTARKKLQFGINLIVYVMITITLVPILARIGGRVAMPIFATAKTPVAPRSMIFVMTNRHYVKTDVREVVFDGARKLRKTYPKSVVHYLDCGFPFWDWFAMLPHLSHGKGEAIDLAFCYHARKKPAKFRPSPSIIGYGIYESPKKGEYNPYKSKFSWFRWDFPWIQWMGWHRDLDRNRTRLLLRHLLQNPKTTKVLLEAHLHKRWGIAHGKLRFQQLKAARHDDHLHLWVRQRR